MAARRVWKLTVGAFFVCSLIITITDCLVVAGETKRNNSEAISTPAPIEDSNSHALATEDSNLVVDGYDESDNAYCGVPLCSPPGRLWVRADWLMWWTSGAYVPSLVTTGTTDSLGILGRQGTTIQYGDTTINRSGRSGTRLTLGGWLDKCHRWGLEADWLTLAGKSSTFSQSSDAAGSPLLSRPYYDILNDVQWIYFVTFPEFLTGSVNVRENDSFSSVGAALRYNLGCNPCADPCIAGEDCVAVGNCVDACSAYYFRTDFLMGYRNYTLGDNLSINSESQEISVDSARRRFQVTDNFITHNEFHGGEIGFSTELRRGRWSVNLLGKMAVGNNHQTVTINGTTLSTANGQVLLNTENGYLAMNSNKGIHTSDRFAIIPQFGAELGCQLTRRLRAYAGYNILFWASVMRAGDQIDLNIDTRNSSVPPVNASPYPAYLARTSDFWAQGLNLGLEFRF